MSHDFVDALRGNWGRQSDISRHSGVDKSIISKAANKRIGLSVEAAEQLGEVLGADPVALFISSNVEAKVAQVDAGEIRAGDALASLSRVAVKINEMHQAGDLPASSELTEAITLLGNAIRELSGEAKKSVKLLLRCSQQSTVLLSPGLLLP